MAGGIAGQVAGLVGAGVMVLGSVVSCLARFGTLSGGVCPLPLAGALVFGRGPLRADAGHGAAGLGGVGDGGGARAWLAGLVLQQVGPALLWGVVFAALVHAVDVRRLESLLATGLGVGLFSYVVDVGLVLPLVFERTLGYDAWRAHVPSLVSIAGHVAYGLALAVFGFVRPHFRGPEW